MEVQILRLFLKVFSIFFLSAYFFYVLAIKDISLKKNYIFINENSNYNKVIENNLIDNSLNIYIYKLVLKLHLLLDNKIHFGKFVLNNKKNFLHFINVISFPSNVYEKFTIIGGWSKNDLNLNLKKNFKNYEELDFYQVLADTYFYNYNSFDNLKKNIDSTLYKAKLKFDSNILSKKFSFKEIIVIGSLLEKEGLDDNDKKNIYSVIINRLNQNMKLQIDATVIYSLTLGAKDLERNLTYEDLKLKSKHNTYYIYGLPPEPISYVSTNTIELILENYKSKYLFYFFNTLENKHIFSVNYDNHLNKLNEYRSKK